jgi:outer membrane immunogenic protein
MKLAIIAASTASVLALAAIPAAASAADQWSGWSGSVGYSDTNVSKGGPDVGGVTGRLSWKSNQFWGVEGEGSFGAKKDTIAGTEYKLNDQFAGYLTATAPISTNFDIFARVGYGTTNIKTTPVGGSGSDQSWNYGAGAEWFWDNHNGLRGDYLRENFQKGGGDANVWSASYVRRF